MMTQDRARILCFGDSNTWGYRPDEPFQRYPEQVRWTGILQKRCGASARVIEEGLNGRTTIWDDPFSAGRNGRAYLVPCLESHRPLDLVIVMLGTNDLKRHFRLSPAEVAQGLKSLCQTIAASAAGRAGARPETLLVSPPPLRPAGELAGLYEGAGDKSQQLARYVSQVASLCKCRFFAAGDVVVCSDIDGVHWTAEGHAAFADAIFKTVGSLLNIP